MMSTVRGWTQESQSWGLGLLLGGGQLLLLHPLLVPHDVHCHVVRPGQVQLILELKNEPLLSFCKLIRTPLLSLPAVPAESSLTDVADEGLEAQVLPLVPGELVWAGELAAAVCPGAREGLLPGVGPRVGLHRGHSASGHQWIAN